jgi:hypothetical protein
MHLDEDWQATSLVLEHLVPTSPEQVKKTPFQKSQNGLLLWF